MVFLLFPSFAALCPFVSYDLLVFAYGFIIIVQLYYFHIIYCLLFLAFWLSRFRLLSLLSSFFPAAASLLLAFACCTPFVPLLPWSAFSSFSLSPSSSLSPPLSFPSSSSFSPSLPFFSPDFRSYYFLLYVFFSSFLCSSSFVFFCFLGSFFLLLFLLLWPFLPSLLSFCCLFLSPVFFILLRSLSSSSSSFSVSFRFFLFLSFSLCIP